MTATTVTRVRGDDWSIPGQLTRSGSAVDLTGATVTAQLRRSPDGDLVATFVVTVTDAAEGELTLSLADTVTDDLRPGTYVYDVQVVDDGTTETFGVQSRLVVKADVTR